MKYTEVIIVARYARSIVRASLCGFVISSTGQNIVLHSSL
jgi:hypothetical protein